MKTKRILTVLCVVVLGIISFFFGWLLGKAVPSVAGEPISSVKMQEVYFSKGYGSVRINIPADWVYEIDENDDTETTKMFSVGFRPADGDGFVKIIHCKNYYVIDALHEQYEYEGSLIALGDKKGSIYVYPGSENWAYIQMDGFMGGYRIYAEEAEWLSEYNDEVLDIISNAVFGEEQLKINDVYKIAEKEVSKNYDDKNGYYDAVSEYWIVRFFYFNDEKMIIVHIDRDGNILTLSEEKL